MTLLAFACGTPPGPDDAGPRFVPTHTRLLGINDVTWLLPLESLDAGSPFPSPIELIPFSTFERLTSAPPAVRTDLGRLRVVGVRFDLCDRATVSPCAEGAAGSVRLVLQPLFGTPQQVEDVALHAFYAVPPTDLPEVVDELRALAEVQDVPRGAALQVNTTFTSSAEYRARLGALISRYAKGTRLDRLTLFGQETEHAALIWIFRGEERTGNALLPIDIADVHATSQEVTLFGADSYLVTPLADAPAGFKTAMMETSFRAASGPQQQEAVQSLLAVDNPLLHSAQTAQCVSCHVSTTLLPPRTQDGGIEASALPEQFRSSTFSQDTVGAPEVRARTLRALGYHGTSPLAAQRVVNESINVLGELEARFPPP